MGPKMKAENNDEKALRQNRGLAPSSQNIPLGEGAKSSHFYNKV